LFAGAQLLAKRRIDAAGRCSINVLIGYFVRSDAAHQTLRPAAGQARLDLIGSGRSVLNPMISATSGDENQPAT